MYPKRTGGVEVHAYQHARILRRDGFDVVVVSKNYDGSRSPNDFGSSRPLVGGLGFLVGSIVALVRVRRRISVIHVHYASYFLVPALVVNALFSKPFIVSCHGFDIQYLRKSRIWKLIQNFAFMRSSYVTCTSRGAMLILSKEYHVPAGKLRLVPNGFDRDEIEAAQLGVVPERKRITYVANLRPVKDPLTAIRAFGIAKVGRPDLSLVVVGAGVMMQTLRSWIFEQGLDGVQLRGKLEHPETLREIALSSIFLLTSVSEGGNPLAVMEAMAMGKAVVVSDIGGPRDVIVDGENGILVTPRSPESFAKAISSVLDDDKLCSQLGAHASASVRNYTWDSSIAIYEKLYATVARLS